MTDKLYHAGDGFDADVGTVRGRLVANIKPFMHESRKRVILIAASILAARKLAQYDGGKRVPATGHTAAC
jgi:hypothetical protein